MAVDHNQPMEAADLASTPRPALPAGAVRLADWGVIRASGAEARKFLQGQLTQDLERLEPGRAVLAGYCSAKGRLLASFVVWGRGPDELLLACSADLLPAVVKRLSMFVLRARCQLSDASAELPLWGLVGATDAEPAPASAPGGPWSLRQAGGAEQIRLPDAPVDGVAVARWLQAGAPPPERPPLPAGAWGWLEVHSGVARVVAATSEQFVPQMVNLELVGGVSFSKGCYPGQEVVARSQYRGTLKRRSYVVHGELSAQPGQEVYSSTDPTQPAGRVVLAGTWEGAAVGERHAALVELKVSAWGAGTLHLGAADGERLYPAALPYAIPAEAA
jgi:folate-binding protein YgfZ